MTTRRDETDRVVVLQGTVDLLILRTLLFGAQHGQGIARAIQQQAEDELLIDHGSLYPALQRLRRGPRANQAEIADPVKRALCALISPTPSAG